MPDSLAGRGVEGNQRIGKEVVADAITTIKIEDWRAGRDKDNATFLVDGHARPVIGCAGIFPGVFGPGVVTELSRPGDGMEGPAQDSSAHIECTDISGRRRMGFRIRPADNDQILVYAAGRSEGD